MAQQEPDQSNQPDQGKNYRRDRKGIDAFMRLH
jgi:hypothetical protein